MIRSFFLITFSFFLCTNPSYAKSLKDSTNTIKKVINIGVPSAAIISLVGINEVWYKNYARSDFHFFDDLKEWNGMDKVGHACTSYQLNKFSHTLFKKNNIKKFENDYWSTSLKELILSSKLGNGRITYYSCGINPEIAKIYMKQKYKRSEYTKKEEASYVIMTNRTLYSDKKQSISNCYDEYNLENVAEVKRNGLVLSAIKKIK